MAFWASSVGGPILTDRFYFFLNFEGYRDSEAISAERTIPTAALCNGVMQYYCLNGDTSQCPGTPVIVNGVTYTPPAGEHCAYSRSDYRDGQPQPCFSNWW